MGAIEAIRAAIGQVESGAATLALLTGDRELGLVQLSPGCCEVSLFAGGSPELAALGFAEDAGVGVARRTGALSPELVHEVLVRLLGLTPGQLPAVEYD